MKNQRAHSSNIVGNKQLLIYHTIFKLLFKKLCDVALAGVAQQTECRPTNRRDAGWIPSQGTCLGCKPGPQ